MKKMHLYFYSDTKTADKKAVVQAQKAKVCRVAVGTETRNGISGFIPLNGKKIVKTGLKTEFFV